MAHSQSWLNQMFGGDGEDSDFDPSKPSPSIRPDSPTMLSPNDEPDADEDNELKAFLGEVVPEEDDSEDFRATDNADDIDIDEEQVKDGEAEADDDEVANELVELDHELYEDYPPAYYESAGVDNPAVVAMEDASEKRRAAREAADDDFDPDNPQPGALDEASDYDSSDLDDFIDDDDTGLLASEASVMADTQFQANERNAKAAQANICKGVEDQMEEKEALEAQGFVVDDMEHGPAEEDGRLWEYIRCKSGTVAPGGRALTQEELDADTDPNDIDYCSCRYCCGLQKRQRRERYAARCQMKDAAGSTL